jgi:hypothetical protein
MVERDDIEEPQVINYEREAEREWTHKESIAREDIDDKFDHAELMWQRTVYDNVTTAIINGAEQIGRDGKCYSLDYHKLKAEGMSDVDIAKHAQIMASYVVG